MRLPSGLLPFLAAATLAIALGVWSRAGDPPGTALGVGLAALIVLLVAAERRHR